MDQSQWEMDSETEGLRHTAQIEAIASLSPSFLRRDCLFVFAISGALKVGVVQWGCSHRIACSLCDWGCAMGLHKTHW